MMMWNVFNYHNKADNFADWIPGWDTGPPPRNLTYISNRIQGAFYGIKLAL